jgi:ATP-dependent Lon protease
MFVTTSNTLNIPAPLMDRMEIIRLSGYTEEEKFEIARRHLIPETLRENGLEAKEFELDDDHLTKIIRGYTREAGVRNLERRIADICRAIAVEVASGKVSVGQKRDIVEQDVEEMLGPEKFYNETAERTELPGVATGLAWTAAGGDILFIEATRMQGKGSLTLTGQLGDVMKESAQAALSYLRSKADTLGIQSNFLERTDIHIHFPAGAIPKDGPSAGVTILTALVSLLTGIRVKSDVCMTGEITLRGLVLPVGGIKEKVLAAHRAGMKRVILPARNEKDLIDVPEQARKELEFVFATHMDEVLKAALEENPVGRKPPHEDPEGGGEKKGEKKAEPPPEVRA